MIKLTDVILNRVNKWKSYKDLEKALKDELLSMNDDELFDAFYTDLEFGTAGMRGVIGAGTNRMNIYVLQIMAFQDIS